MSLVGQLSPGLQVLTLTVTKEYQVTFATDQELPTVKHLESWIGWHGLFPKLVHLAFIVFLGFFGEISSNDAVLNHWQKLVWLFNSESRIEF
jgi:hypothetical protein